METWLWTQAILSLKHYFDTWKFSGILKTMLQDNFMLNKSCEALHDNRRAWVTECNALKQDRDALMYESNRAIRSLINAKMERAEEAWWSMRRRGRSKRSN